MFTVLLAWINSHYKSNYEGTFLFTFLIDLYVLEMLATHLGLIK